MNIVIPQNFQEAFDFWNFLKGLDRTNLNLLIEFYKSKGYDLDVGDPDDYRNYFLITKNNQVITFDGNNYFLSFSLKKQMIPHRIGGPAVENALEGYREWYQNGERHREDGPALEYESGTKYWFYRDAPLDKYVVNLIKKVEDYLYNSIKVLISIIKEANIPYDSVRSSQRTLLSLIQFLWENGYQFDEYLSGSVESERNRMNIFTLKALEDKTISEESFLQNLKHFYVSHMLLLNLKKIEDDMMEGNEYERESASKEVMSNIRLIVSNSSVEDLFNSWKQYSELNEAMSLSKYWEFNL